MKSIPYDQLTDEGKDIWHQRQFLIKYTGYDSFDSINIVKAIQGWATGIQQSFHDLELAMEKIDQSLADLQNCLEEIKETL